MVLPALLVFGPLSDAKGRREPPIPAIVLAAASAGLFAAASCSAGSAVQMPSMLRRNAVATGMPPGRHP